MLAEQKTRLMLSEKSPAASAAEVKEINYCLRTLQAPSEMLLRSAKVHFGSNPAAPG